MSPLSRMVDVDESHVLKACDLPAFISRQVSMARRFYFALATTPGTRLHLALGGWERVQPEYAIHRPRFPYYSIEFVAEGKGRITLANEEHELVPGALFGYGPGCPLEMSTDPKSPLVKYYATFCGSAAKSILQSAGISPCGFKQIGTRHQVQDIFEVILTNGLNHTRWSQRICGLLLHALSLKIAEQKIAGSQGINSRAYATYLRVRDLIDRDYLKLRSIEEVAAECGLTVPYICQIFKRYSHLTPYHHLTRQRMQYAADLLSDPSVLIKQVARQLEFADQYQFSRAFKRVFGISPAEFRFTLLKFDG
jgi:AraC-like DNA-binding protein